jgi:hypothetical protein
VAGAGDSGADDLLDYVFFEVLSVGVLSEF